MRLRVTTSIKVHKRLLLVYAIALILCAVCFLLGLIEPGFWIAAVGFMLFLLMSLLACLISLVVWSFSKKVQLRGSMWFVCAMFSVFIAWRCYYDWFVYTGWFKGLEALIWLMIGVPPIVLIVGYLLVTAFIRRRRGNDDNSSEG